MFIAYLIVQAATGAPTNPVHTYSRCVTVEALSLVPSGEPASVVVDAAMTQCEKLVSVAVESINLKAAENLSPVEQPKFRAFAAGNLENQKGELRATVRERALLAVVKWKANTLK